VIIKLNKISMPRMTIGRKIIVICMTIILIFTIMTTYMLYHIKSMDNENSLFANNTALIIGGVKDVRSELWLRNTYIRNYILTGD
jgi:methyl-accepting chemotaxis protein